jgi:NAD(P)-dependent dehydrogenase (short-subunit alcohol dehydrogenase family)
MRKIKKDWKTLDILVNNAGIQFPENDIENISDEQILENLYINIISMIALTRDLLTLMKKGSRIICTTSVTAYRGSDHLIDYSATKGAIATFIRSLATNIAEKEFSKRRCSRSDLDSSCRKLSTIFNFWKR